jgi:hypothetical protein
VLKVVERMFLGTAQMDPRAMYQFAKFPSLFQAVEQV